jgi:hypothetical protein
MAYNIGDSNFHAHAQPSTLSIDSQTKTNRLTAELLLLALNSKVIFGFDYRSHDHMLLCNGSGRFQNSLSAKLLLVPTNTETVGLGPHWKP